MELQEYRQKLVKLLEEHQQEIKDLQKLYCDSNNIYKEGDIIKDHIGFIKITRIEYTYSTAAYQDCVPRCLYYGLELRKDGRPKVKNIERAIWQHNIV